MLLGDKERTIRLHAENFLYGNLTFDHGILEEERLRLATTSKEFAKELALWVRDDSGNVKTEEHTKRTGSLYYNILGWHVRGRIKGLLKDTDIEEENSKLKDENVRLKLQVEEYKKDTITALSELKDARSLLEQYEKAVGIGKQ